MLRIVLYAKDETEIGQQALEEFKFELEDTRGFYIGLSLPSLRHESVLFPMLLRFKFFVSFPMFCVIILTYRFTSI